MSCPACGAPVVAFTVPPALREHAPATESAICSSCLRIVAASDASDASDDAPAPADADFAAVHESFPTGEGGVAFALALGKLDSLALQRAAIEELCDAAERAGVDVRLALERLADAETLDPSFDVGRRSQQLASFR